VGEPTTELDARFSDPRAAPVSWDATVLGLEAAELFWITTVRVDGRPHVSPVVGVWLDEAIHFSTGAAEQKAVNLRGNPHVILTTGCNRWDTGLDIVVEGDAVAVTDDGMLQRLAEAWRTKWDGRWEFQVRDGAFHHDAGTALVFSVTPLKVLAFGKGTYTHTGHRFGAPRDTPAGEVQAP
jgi:general stress protein 26